MPWSWHTFILPFVAHTPAPADDPDGLTPAVFVSSLDMASHTSRRRGHDESGKAEFDFHKIPLDAAHWASRSWLQDEPPDWLTQMSCRIDSPGGTPTCSPQETLFDTYNTFQFFTDAARDLAFGRKPQGDPQLARHFELLPFGQSLKDCHYIIDWTEQASRTDPSAPPKHYRYDLDLVRIRLITYNTFVSILVLETEYRQPDHHELEDILRINEYGRRICYPYLHLDLVRTLTDTQPHGHPRVADSITITGLQPADQPVKADFIFQSSSESWTEQLEFQYVMEPLKIILSRWTNGHEATSSVRQAIEAPAGTTGFVVQPVMDSRMFVCCLYRDDEFSTAATKYDDHLGRYAALSPRAEDDAVANAFYAFAFIDAGRPTCQNRALRAQRLAACVYDRWGDDKVLHAVTDRSFVALVSQSDPTMDFAVIRPFRSTHLDMVIFALAQKASIMQMSHRAADLADQFDKVSAADNTESSLIALLERKNALMQNQVILSEVTTMVQGREMFTLMRDQLDLTASNAELITQLEYLYQMDAARAQMRQRLRDARTAWSLNALAMGLGLLAIPSTLMSWFTAEDYWAKLVGGISFIVFFVIFGVTLLALWRRRRGATRRLGRASRRKDGPSG
jgi:hypothetical protein